MTLPKPPQWLGIQAGARIEFEIPTDGLFIAALTQAGAKNHELGNLGATLDLQQLQWLMQRSDAGRKWLDPIEGYFDRTRYIRIVGSDAAVRAGQRVFATLGIRLESPVHLPAGSRQVQFIPAEGRIRAARAANRRVKVLVVDDSEAIRKLLNTIVGRDPRLECVGAVALPSLVDDAIQKLKPDVITMDIHMPEMTGVELLKKLIPSRPIPVVMITSLSLEEGGLVLDALAAGAVDYIQKPSFNELDLVAPLICDKIHSAASARVQKFTKSPTSSAPLVIDGPKLNLDFLTVIGSSTGGTEALKDILTRLPAEIPPILICQHLPEVFSKAFADRLNTLCPFEVREAQDGDLVKPSCVLIAPGGRQMKVKVHHDGLRIVIEGASPARRHNPSVDVLFESVNELALKKVAAMILTGMGSDGAQGMRKLRDSGARTFSQDEASCVVYGMPREAVLHGGSEKVLPLSGMAQGLLSVWSQAGRKPKAA